MASWTLKQTGLNDSFSTGKTVSILETGGVKKAYIYNNDGHVLEYNASTDTLTAISDGTSFGGDSMPTTIGYRPGPVVFGGEVYCYVHDAGAVNDGVWKWDGTDESGWTRVFDAGGTLYRFFVRTENHLVLAPYPDAAYTTKYSSDGSSWSDAATSDDSPAALGFSYSSKCFFSGDHSLGAFLYDRSTDGGSPAGSIIVRLFKWSESNTKWEIVNSGDTASGVDTGDYWLDGLDYIATYYWRQAYTDYEYSSDRSSWITPATTPDDIEPVWLNGFDDVPTSLGWFDSPSFIVYQLNPDNQDWEDGETDFTGLGASPNLNAGFRFSGGDTYVIIKSDDGTEIWGRSQPIAGTTEATFYQGVDTLEVKATLAVDDPGPHGMAINDDREEVVIVSGVAGTTMAEKLTSEDSFATTEDYTSGLDISEALNVVRYI